MTNLLNRISASSHFLLFFNFWYILGLYSYPFEFHFASFPTWVLLNPLILKTFTATSSFFYAPTGYESAWCNKMYFAGIACRKLQIKCKNFWIGTKSYAFAHFLEVENWGLRYLEPRLWLGIKGGRQSGETDQFCCDCNLRPDIIRIPTAGERSYKTTFPKTQRWREYFKNNTTWKFSQKKKTVWRKGDLSNACRFNAHL